MKEQKIKRVNTRRINITILEKDYNEIHRIVEENKYLSFSEFIREAIRTQLNKNAKNEELKNNIRLMEKIKNGEVKPERAIRLINTICENLGEEYRADLMKYIKMDDAIIEKQKEEKENGTKDKESISQEKIEEVTKETTLGEINDETQVIRGEIERKSIEQLHEDNEGVEKDDKITLQTVHASKGKEYNIVFIIGANESNFPLSYAKTEEDIAEERRLFYVGMTRAKKKLYISYALENEKIKDNDGNNRKFEKSRTKIRSKRLFLAL